MSSGIPALPKKTQFRDPDADVEENEEAIPHLQSLIQPMIVMTAPIPIQQERIVALMKQKPAMRAAERATMKQYQRKPKRNVLLLLLLAPVRKIWKTI
jgi:hypothetical protein